MEVEAALTFVEKLVFAKTQKGLTDIQRAVFRGCWQGKTFKQIYYSHENYAERCGFEHFEKNVGPGLWKLLSEVLASEGLSEKVLKKNLQGSVERVWQKICSEESSTSAAIGKEDDVILKPLPVAWTEERCPLLAVEKQPTEANMLVVHGELEPQMTEDEVSDNRLTNSMNPLDSARVIRQEMLRGIEVTGNLEAGDAIQEAQSGNSVEQIMAADLKAGTIKFGNLTQDLRS